MKKILIYLLFCFIFIFELVGCKSISRESIKENAYNYLDYRAKASVSDWSKASIEKIKFNEDYFISNKESISINIKDKETYIVIFATNDDILGPIKVYVNEEDLTILGLNYRE